jgi:integrase
LGNRWRSKDDLKDLVFTTGMGSPCVRYVVEKEIKKALKRMTEKEGVLAIQEDREPREIRDFHPHSLRHTFATRCFENKTEGSTATDGTFQYQYYIKHLYTCTG